MTDVMQPFSKVEVHTVFVTSGITRGANKVTFQEVNEFIYVAYTGHSKNTGVAI